MAKLYFETPSVTSQDLIELIKPGFPRDHPIHAKTDFSDKPVVFDVVDTDKKPTTKRPLLDSKEMRDRLERLCKIYHQLSLRGKDFDYPEARVWDASSVIVSNLLSMHGFLGTHQNTNGEEVPIDGHGRGLHSFIGVAFDMSGYPRPRNLPTYASAEADPLMAFAFLFHMNGHVTAGSRAAASWLEMRRTGTVPDLLMSSSTIWESSTRRKANVTALSIIGGMLKNRYIRR